MTERPILPFLVTLLAKTLTVTSIPSNRAKISQILCEGGHGSVEEGRGHGV